MRAVNSIRRFLAKFRRAAPPPEPINIKPPDFVQIDGRGGGVSNAVVAIAVTITLIFAVLIFADPTAAPPAPVKSPPITPVETPVQHPPVQLPPSRVPDIAPAAPESDRRVPMNYTAPPTRSEPRARETRYHTGKRGGCYAITSGGKKRYVDRSNCP